VKSDLQFLHRFYSLLLNLYPGTYREEYGEELQTVFILSIDDATKTGKFETAKVVLGELISLPMAVFFEHLRERRKAKMIKNFNSRFDFAPGSRKEVLAAVAPFLLFGAIPILVGLSGRLNTRPYFLEELLSMFMLASMISLLTVGFFRSIPRWFMPYLGLPLPILSLYIFNGLVDEWDGYSLPDLSSRFLRGFVQDGLLWGPLIPLILLLVVFSVIIPRFRPFYRQLRNDWTLLSFILYGAAPVMALVWFEGYINYGPFVVLMFLILAAGGWLYLRNDVPWRKFLILIGGMTLSMLTAAVGQAVLYESSQYNSRRPYTNLPWWNTVDQTVIAWMWLVLIMFLPLVINLLPRPRSSLQAGEPVSG